MKSAKKRLSRYRVLLGIELGKTGAEFVWIHSTTKAEEGISLPFYLKKKNTPEREKGRRGEREEESIEANIVGSACSQVKRDNANSDKR